MLRYLKLSPGVKVGFINIFGMNFLLTFSEILQIIYAILISVIRAPHHCWHWRENKLFVIEMRQYCDTEAKKKSSKWT